MYFRCIFKGHYYLKLIHLFIKFGISILCDEDSKKKRNYSRIIPKDSVFSMSYYAVSLKNFVCRSFVNFSGCLEYIWRYFCSNLSLFS